MLFRQTVYLFCMVLLVAAPVYAKKCSPEDGNLAAKAGEVKLAFSKLQHCANESNVSGETLFHLAVLYLHPDIGGFKSDAKRLMKVYKLLRRASAKGNEQALVTLASMYESGEALISIKTDEKKAACLLMIADQVPSDTAGAVSNCIGQI